jgi:hypothetical protein
LNLVFLINLFRDTNITRIFYKSSQICGDKNRKRHLTGDRGSTGLRCSGVWASGDGGTAVVRGAKMKQSGHFCKQFLRKSPEIQRICILQTIPEKEPRNTLHSLGSIQICVGSNRVCMVEVHPQLHKAVLSSLVCFVSNG